MGFWGNSSLKRRQMFDPSGDLGPMDPGMSMPDYAGQAAASLPDPSSAPSQKPGFFGAGGVGRGIAGSIGDFLLQLNHMAPVYAPAMEHQRDMQDRQQLSMQDREAALDVWKRQQEYEAEHPKQGEAPEPVRLAAAYRAMGRPDLAAGVEAKSAAMSGTNAAGQPVAMNPASLFPGPGEQAAQPSGPPPSAAEYLKQHPDLAPQFDQKYGAGASMSILGAGGVGQSGPRTFRSRTKFFGSGY